MTKRSAFSQLAISFIGIYALYSLAMNLYLVCADYSKDSARRLQNESFYAKIGHILLEHNEAGDLEDRLSDALTSDQIGFYSIRRNGQDVSFASAAGADDYIQIPLDGKDGDYENAHDGYHYFLIHSGPYQLAIGHKTDLGTYIGSYWKTQKNLLLKDLLFVTFLTFALILFSFRDLLQILRSFKTVGLKRGDESLARSQETLTLVRGLQGYENQIVQLQFENTLFKNQVLPALRKELESGREAPYEFSCTLVRADINNFTSIFSNHDRSAFMQTINEFFVGVTHIVSRYNGFVYEFIGDEVLFYFKDDDHENSAAIALSALTDITRLADDIHARVLNERDYGFKIKSSVAHGTLRYGALVNGFSLAGVPLIESVRMLSHVHEKSDHVVLLDEIVHAQTSWLCKNRELGVVLLKGLNGSRHLYQFEERAPLSLHLRQQCPEALRNVRYYRADDEIAQSLTYLKEQRLELSDLCAQTLIAELRAIPMTAATSRAVKSAYLSLVDELLEDTQPSLHLLASVVALATTLITPDAFQGRLSDRLKDCLRHRNARVAANAVEVFSALDPHNQDRIFKALASGESTNRVLANILVKDGKSAFNKAVARRLKSMLRGKSPFDKASALFALGEIAAHARFTDQVAYRTNSSLHALLAQALDLCFHANAMVRRQAFGALEKSDRLSHLGIRLDDEAYVRRQDLSALKDLRQRMSSQSESSQAGAASASILKIKQN